MDGRRLLLAVGVVGFVVIVSIVIFSIDWGGGGQITNDTKKVNLTDYANTNTQVRMTVRGLINSNQEHEELQITVGVNDTTGQLLSGYQGNAVRTEQTPNNIESYGVFLSALHNSGFLEKQLPNKNIQYAGACPRGLRYTFEFIGGEETPESLWATNCHKSDGSFAGDLTVVKALFNDQLPKPQYRALTDNTQF